MKSKHWYSLLVLGSILLLSIVFAAFYSSSNLGAFVQSFANYTLTTSELPDWLLYVFGIVFFIHFFRIISFFNGVVKNPHIGYLGMLIVLTSCQELKSCLTNPGPKDWTETCEFFSSPVHAHYTVDFYVSLSDLPPTFTKLADVEVNCKVIRVRRAFQAWDPDSCYWSEELVDTFIGTTDVSGRFTFNFDIDFDSGSDYLILEGSYEKQGYYRRLFSSDERWYFYQDDFVKCNMDYIPFRYVKLYYGTIPIDISP